MKRVIMFGLVLIVTAVLLSDSTANARERGGRKARRGGGQQTYSTSNYSQPTRVVYQYPPYEMTHPMNYPPSNMGYTSNNGYATNPGYSVPSYPTNPGYPANYRTMATPPAMTQPTTPATPELTPELIALIQALRAAGYVK